MHLQTFSELTQKNYPITPTPIVKIIAEINICFTIRVIIKIKTLQLIMKKILYSLLAINIIFLSGCSQIKPSASEENFSDNQEITNSTNTETSKSAFSQQPEEKNSNENHKEINRVSDTQGTSLVKTKSDDRFVYYNGTITLSGKYQLQKEGILSNKLCFYPDNKTGHLIPRDPNLYGEGNGDNRNPWFCFNDQEVVKKQFNINNDSILKDKETKCIQGKATVTISNYKVDKMESSVFDTADLEEILSKEIFKTHCE